MDTLNCSSSRSVFSILNKKENNIQQWFPKENLHNFSCSKLYIDSFNEIIYSVVNIKDDFDYKLSDCQDNTPSISYIYQTTDEGKTWVIDNGIKKMFVDYKLQRIKLFRLNPYVGIHT